MIDCAARTITELRQQMTRIRRLGVRPLTNYFNQCNHCTEPLESWVEEGALAFCWQDNEVSRVYYYAVDQEQLVKVLSMVPSGSCLDYISRARGGNAEIFVAAGFTLYAEYGRFVYGSNAKSEKLQSLLRENDEAEKELFEADYGEQARVEDAEEIDALLRRHFDPYRSHLYDMETLRDHIRRGWVWVARENGTIVALQAFEMHGDTMYGAYTVNEGPVEAMVALKEKVARAARRLGRKRGFCWINLSNKRALRYQIQFEGMEFDNLYDVIYLK